jgi:predicted TPR repeat methyltransferase
MTRAQAAELVRAHGGQWTPTVTRHTSLLIVGQEGWPVAKDGRLSAKLRKARHLQQTQRIDVISEAELLARLGFESATRFQLFSTAQLSQVLKVPGARLRRWADLGLIRPARTTHGVHYFDFRQATWARSLCHFIRAGITPRRIRQSLEQLRCWLSDVDEPLSQLSVLEENGQLLVRLEEGQLFEPTGQGLFDFDREPGSATVALDIGPSTAEQWFELACGHEDAGRLPEAARAYRQVLLRGGPDKDACFNLANVLHALGRMEQAAERYRQALELDQNFVEAWNNLGNTVAELKEYDEAIEALEKTLELNPHFTDAHFNLADALEKAGREQEAAEHWRAYLHEDVCSPWARYARRRLQLGRA